MPPWEGTRQIAIVSACRNSNGSPEFTLTEVEATAEQTENVVHYYLAEAELFEEGYEEPFVHFDEFESPVLLHRCVRRHLDRLCPTPEPTHALAEDS